MAEQRVVQPRGAFPWHCCSGAAPRGARQGFCGLIPHGFGVRTEVLLPGRCRH